MTDDLLTDKIEDINEDAEIEEPNEIEDMPPVNIGEDGEVVDDDEAIISDEFTPVDGEGEFDPEDPDAYLYNAPKVTYADSAEEDEATSPWATDDEF